MSGLFSSFNASILGLNANATRLSTISDNIANSGTAGYKRMRSSFHSVVLGGGGSYMAGGVRASTMRMIDQRGALAATNNPTDLAVNGRGFLPVTPQSALTAGGNMPLQLMTTGSFRPDAQGILRTQSGMVLLGWPVGPDGSIGTPPRDSAGGLRPVQITGDRFSSDPTTRVGLRVNLPANDTREGGDGSPRVMSMEYYTALGATERLSLSFEPDVPDTGQSNTWTMRITDPRNGDAVVGEYTITFSDTPPDAGKIISVTQADGAPGGAYDPETGTMSISVDGQEIDVDIGRPGSSDGITQMASSFETIAMDRDGSPVQTLLGVEVDERGFVQAIYDSGLIRPIAQIPVVDVPNPNGLEALEGQSYRVTGESGALFLWNAGDGPTGEVAGYALEGSTADVAEELTNMIQTQRAYSSNAKVIQTVDEMLQETANLKR
ncbi:MAG: flagellar hook-basal body complex protein [Pararhodobacter sp.]|nr:flagellar hook-basal body complex protein [Pararhodobacter sp.]